MQTINETLDMLKASKFRAGFALKEKDKAFIREKRIDTIRRHAQDFVCCYPKRRKANADARPSDISRTACLRPLLPGMPQQVVHIIHRT